MALTNLECPICQQSLLTAQLCSCIQDEDQSSESTVSSATFNSSLEVRRRHTNHHNQCIDPSRFLPMCTPCGHIFHKACITEWFRVRRHFDNGNSVRCTCPSCRKPISFHKLIRVYLPAIPTATDVCRSTRISVTEAVRRYNEQHLISRDVITERERRINRSRIYSEFFELCNSSLDERAQEEFHDLPFQASQGGRNRQEARSQDQERSVSQQNGLELMEYSCQSEDCVALQNVYQILSMEFKSQQRKLEQEMDISKMKSLLITGLQRDIEQLRRMNANIVPLGGRTVWVLLISFIGFWITAVICAILF